MPRSARAAGDNTARVTILAKLGPPLVLLELEGEGDDPGRGGNDGGESAAVGCRSARTEGGGLKFGGGLGRLFGR